MSRNQGRSALRAARYVIWAASVTLAACADGGVDAADDVAPTANNEVAATPSRADVAPVARFRASARPVAGSYIVVLAAGTAAGDVAATTDALLARYGGARTAVYTEALQGFSARMPEAAARRLSEDPRVAYVEQDGVLHATQVFGADDATLAADATGSTTPPQPEDAVSSWALDRIDQRAGPPVVGGVPQFDGQYTWHATGAGVNVYLLDSGVSNTNFHTDFITGNNRVGLSVDYVNDGSTDCYGHGTSMASIIAGRIAGVAKEANVRSVRVLDCNNETSLATLLQGTDWIAANAVRPAVVNMSLSGPVSAAWNAAIANLVNTKGILVVGAAGNDNVSACTTSPASEPTTLTVGSVNGFDARSTFSNYGSCVDLSAPGTSTDAADNNASATFDPNARIRRTGTSVSTAFVTGAAALYLERYPLATPTEVRNALITNATTGYLNVASLNGSPDKLLYTNFVPYAAQNGSGQELGSTFVTNGGFESGATGWSTSGFSAIITGSSDAWSGTAYLRAGYTGADYFGTGTPLKAWTVLTGGQATANVTTRNSLRFRLKVNTSRFMAFSAVDVLQVKIKDSNNRESLIGTYSNLSNTAFANANGYTEEWIDLGRLGGASPPTVSFTTTTSGAPMLTDFYVDNVRFVRATTATAAWNALANADFEAGNNGSWTWTRSAGSAFVAGSGALDGLWTARLGGWSDNTAHTDTLYQNLTIPAGTANPRIRIPVTITTTEPFAPGSPAVDTLAIQVRNATTGAVLATLATYSNLQGVGTQYTAATYSLAPWVGQTVRLYFNAVSNNNNKATSFTIDNVETFAGAPAWTSPVL